MKKKILCLGICVMMLFSFSLAEVSVIKAEEINEKSAFDTYKLDLFRQMIQNLYYENVPDQVLYEGALKGMFNALDEYSDYYNKEESQTFDENTSGSYQGIGIKFEGLNDYMHIIKVFSNTPADVAGLRARDYIVEINGEDVKGWTTSKAASLIKGEPGTSVKLTINREGKIFDVDILRAQVQAESCNFKMLDDNIGLIEIEEFNTSTGDEVSRYLKAIELMGSDKVIIDLRDNPGGYIDQAVSVSRNFIIDNVVTTLKYKDGRETEYYSYLEHPKFKLVVLVNENSASSSEIFAGAVKDTKTGIIVGTQTYGKGVIQNVYNLVDGGSVKITTGAYYTPNNISIHKVGITPDIVIENKVEGEDTQLNRAIEEIKKL